MVDFRSPRPIPLTLPDVLRQIDACVKQSATIEAAINTVVTKVLASPRDAHQMLWLIWRSSLDQPAESRLPTTTTGTMAEYLQSALKRGLLVEYQRWRRQAA